MAASGQKLRDHTFNCKHDGESMSWEAGWGYELAEPASSDGFPPVRLQLLKVPWAPQTALPTGDQVQIREPIGGRFSFKPSQPLCWALCWPLYDVCSFPFPHGINHYNCVHRRKCWGRMRERHLVKGAQAVGEWFPFRLIWTQRPSSSHSSMKNKSWDNI